MRFEFKKYPHHLTGVLQMQCRCMEKGKKVMYLPDWKTSLLEVDEEGVWEGEISRQITPQGMEPVIVIVTVTKHVPNKVIEQERKMALEKRMEEERKARTFTGHFVLTPHHDQVRYPGKMQWKREFNENEILKIHIVDNRNSPSQTPSSPDTVWTYELAQMISDLPGVEIWTVMMLEEHVSTRAKNRREKFEARQRKTQERLDAEEEARQRKAKEHKERLVRQASKDKSGKKGKKQVA